VAVRLTALLCGVLGRPGREAIDDVGFITAAVDDIGRNIAIDRGRVYATGISNGCMMAYALACNTGTFAAIGPDTATQLDPCASHIPPRSCTFTARRIG
jgi:polyhydroxybutyrate depolymerase